MTGRLPGKILCLPSFFSKKVQIQLVLVPDNNNE